MIVSSRYSMYEDLLIRPRSKCVHTRRIVVDATTIA